jgi:aryl-alcohol dehydrogenase-like predicted oxidoreductase
MRYVTVGSTGLQVSPLCFGTMSFGSEADETTSAAMFHRVREKGINFFDTADVYGGGASEEIRRVGHGPPRRHGTHAAPATSTSSTAPSPLSTST